MAERKVALTKGNRGNRAAPSPASFTSVSFIARTTAGTGARPVIM
jgi:hypothetical protein